MFSCRIMVFLFLIRILIDCKTQNKLFSFSFSHYSNSYITKTTGFPSSTMVEVQNFLVVDNFSVERLSVCAACIKVWTIRKNQNLVFFFKSLNIQFFSIKPLKVQSPPNGTQSKNNTCTGVLS